MSDLFPHLPNAPIQEAMIVFQADLIAHWDGIKELADEVLFPFQLEGQRQSFEGTFAAGEKGQVEGGFSNVGIEAWIYRQENSPIVLQVQKQGFSCSMLAPYSRWDDLKSIALDWWGKFSKRVGVELELVHVRFVNDFSVQLGVLRYRDIFRNDLSPPDPKWSIAAFSNRACYSAPELGAMVAMTISRDAPKIEGEGRFVLDITASLSKPLTAHPQPLEDVLENLRIAKNKAFYNTLSEEVLKQFQ